MPLSSHANSGRHRAAHTRWKLTCITTYAAFTTPARIHTWPPVVSHADWMWCDRPGGKAAILCEAAAW
jgi:hypothetical protein